MGFNISRLYEEDLTNDRAKEINDRFEQMEISDIFDFIKKDMLKIETSYSVGDASETVVATKNIEKLLEVLARLTDSGNSVVVIEHNLDVIKTADHIIDLGPDGGDGGGQVIATGTPEEIAKSGTYTGKFLEKMLNENITPYAKELVEDFGK